MARRTAKYMSLAGACLIAAAIAAPALARQYFDSTSMKGMTVLECTGEGRWARGPMEAREMYAIDAAGQDILRYDAQSQSFSSICQPGADCAIDIGAAQYSLSRQEGDTTLSLAIARETGGWTEDQNTASDRQAFIKKSGVCKARRNPLGKNGPKTKF